MLTDYLHYKLKTPFEDLKDELISIGKNHYGLYDCYRSEKYSIITFFGKELKTEVHLSFSDGKIIEIHYLFFSKELEYIKLLVDSFTTTQKEKLCQNWLYDELHLHSFTPNYTATIERIDKDFIMLSISKGTIDEEE